MFRSNKLDELRITDIHKKVFLSGWVSEIRNFGSLVFIDLRDRYGKTQIVLNQEILKEKNIKQEYVIKVEGVVRERSNKNPNIKTGAIEVEAQNIEVLSKSKLLPFDLKADNISETLRLQYRYLDLRREKMKNNIIKRSNMLYAIRNFMNKEGFLDIDTPILGKSTPEGARDFLVPSRIYNGQFYALPQSPQLFKQTLMIAGLDKYYQVAKCFRDEDLRKDRQLEFTQIDMEMSYITQEDILNVVEKMAKYVTKEVVDREIEYDFPRITYDYAMNTYGSDKPDTRFEMKIQDVKDILSKLEFNVFKEAKQISAIVCDTDKFSRKDIKVYEDFVKTYYKAKGLVYIKISEQETTSSINKFLTDEVLEELKSRLNITKNQTIFIIADDKKIVLQALGALRLRLAEELNLIDENKLNYLWVIDFPMFEYSEEEQRCVAQHHPFTTIKKDDLEKLERNDLEDIKTDSYDLVLNGFEIGGGSIRIHDSNLQSLVFEKLGLTKEEQENKFGFFLETLKYGVPPHGGLAFGFDRWLMVLLKENSIKDVIPFPKSNKGQDLMTEAPSFIDEKQLKELSLEIKKGE